MKHIDADKLIAEIERRMTENCKLAEKAKCYGDRAVEDNDILAFIEQFQQEQPEVDLEKEINSYCGTRDIRPVPDFMDAVARHFYELGLNARKEE